MIYGLYLLLVVRLSNNTIIEYNIHQCEDKYDGKWEGTSLNRIAQEVQMGELPEENIILTAHTSYVIDVDPRLVVSIDFGKASVVIEPWEKAAVRVTPNEYFDSYVELLNEHNLILFDHENYFEENPSMSDRAGFVVKVPKSAALSIVAGQCVVRDCIVISVKSEKLELHDCILVDNFKFRGEYARVQGSTIGKHGSFNARTTVMRHCTCSTLILHGNSKYADLSVELRHVRANGVWLGSQQVLQLYACLQHVRVSRLVVDGAIETGSVNLDKTRIAQIENNSSIPITKSVLGHRRECA